jgi:hypothetical protein
MDYPMPPKNKSLKKDPGGLGQPKTDTDLGVEILLLLNHTPIMASQALILEPASEFTSTLNPSPPPRAHTVAQPRPQ